jgi:hypothetical protein
MSKANDTYNNVVNLEDAKLLVDSRVGVYLPKHFWETRKALNVTPELTQAQIDEFTADLSHPENDHYWDAFDDLMQTTWKDDQGKEYNLYQDENGDLWLI